MWGLQNCSIQLKTKFLQVSFSWEAKKYKMLNPQEEYWYNVEAFKSHNLHGLLCKYTQMLICTHTQMRIINAFHFKVLAIFWWHSHSSRVKKHLTSYVSIIKYFKQHPPPPPPSPPRDRCRYHFCQSQFPSAFVIPAHIYELSIAVSGCKVTDVLRGGIGWDYLGLSINAYSPSLSLFPMPLLPHKSQSIVGL